MSDGRLMPLRSSALRLASIAVALSAVATAADGDWHLLLPAGAMSARDGRGPFLVGDQAAMQRIVAASLARAGSTELVVDYDHQTVFAAVPEVGGRAPAAGWIKQLEVRADGIWGRIEWVAAAATAIKAHEYRYLSPVFVPDKSGQVQLILSVALTNSPAIDLMAVAASAFAFTDGVSMKQIAEALGLSADADEATILASIGKLVSFRNQAAGAVALAATATDDAIVGAVTALKAGTVDPKNFVPVEQVVALQTELGGLKTSIAADKAKDAVDKAITDGKLAPALKDWGLARAKADLADFEAFVAGAPVVVSPARDQQRRQGADTPVIEEADTVVMRALGLTEAEVLAAKKSEIR